MMDYYDINAEYERIFGVEHRTTLFDGDPEYDQFRQIIINTPKCETNNEKLPFEDFHLISYDEYCRMDVLKGFEKRHLKIFFIRRYEGEKLVCYGAGYFSPSTSRFVIIRLSYSQINEYHRLLLRSIPSLNKALEDNYFTFNDGRIQLEKQLPVDSASLAASFILGKSTTFTEWKDREDKTLGFYYPNFDNLFGAYNEYEFNSITENWILNNSIEEKVKIEISNIIRSLQKPFTTLITSIKINQREGFVSIAERRLAEEKRLAEESRKANERRKAEELCRAEGRRKAEERRLEEEKRKFNKAKQILSQETEVDFYLEDTKSSKKKFKAQASYDQTTGKLKLKRGSLLALEDASSFRYTTAGIKRINVISQSCIKKANGYSLFKDVILEDHDMAASIVVGQLIDGKKAWSTEDGLALFYFLKSYPPA